MGRELSSPGAGCLAMRQQHVGNRLVVTLTGHLELDAVEQLAACADRICRSPVRGAVFDVAALAAVDEAGARTLAAACRCLRLHGVLAEVRGVRGQLRQVIERLGLVLPEPPGVIGGLRAQSTAPVSAPAGA
jgi:anti-anti-sigma regulatory factor